MQRYTVALELFAKRLSSRSVLTDKEHTALVEIEWHPKRYASDADIVRPGQKVDHCCLVVDGVVGRFGQNRDGARQLSGLYISGDMADLHFVVSPKAGWGIVALGTTSVLHIPHISLRRVAARHPAIAEALWRDCAADTSIMSEWVVSVGRRGAVTRIAHLFCEMAMRSEQAGLGARTSFPLPIRQMDLADATGLTAVHVNRMLQQLRTSLVMELRAGIVTIHDWQRLVTIGDFDPAFLLLDRLGMPIEELIQLPG